MATAPALSVPSANIGDVDACVTDAFIVVEGTASGCTVAGREEARIAHAWPRDPSSSDVFAQWRWDGAALTVHNDRWGFQPIFYVASKNRIAVSPSIHVLLRLGAPVDLDDEALAVFLRLSHFLGTDTPFRSIRALPRAGCLTWRPGAGAQVSVESQPQRAERLSRKSALDAYVTLFSQAMRRRLPRDGERIIVPLSGGRDSRLILFELVRAGCRPHETVTIHHYPPAGDDDSVIAPQVAAAAGVPHVAIPLDPRRVAIERRKNAMTGFCADRHAQMMPLVDYLRGRADVIYDGLGGDILSGTRLQAVSREIALLANGRCDELATLHLHAHSSEEALRAVLQPAAFRRFSFEAARRRVAEECRRHVDAPHPWGSFRVQNRTARSVALLPFGMLARSARVMTPYLDRDLSAFLAALPTSLLADGRLHAEVIARGFPEHAHIRYEDGKGARHTGRAYYRRLSWDLAREALRMTASPLVRRAFLVPRLMKWAAQGTPPWIGDRRVVYLMQLEELVSGVPARWPVAHPRDTQLSHASRTSRVEGRV
jgi:asparagine synthase (glutamine-hydrolysing)